MITLMGNYPGQGLSINGFLIHIVIVYYNNNGKKLLAVLEETST
jgi:hypothetical protein